MVLLAVSVGLPIDVCSLIVSLFQLFNEVTKEVSNNMQNNNDFWLGGVCEAKNHEGYQSVYNPNYHDTGTKRFDSSPPRQVKNSLLGCFLFEKILSLPVLPVRSEPCPAYRE